MIAYLHGKIKYRGDDYLIMEVANVGYKVFVARNFLNKLKVDSDLELYTYQHVREESLDLFGFSSINDLNFFEKLNTVSGIGPRSAMAVLEAAPAEEVVKAILRSDERTLVAVYGISKKKAEKIIMELKGKVDKLETASSQAKSQFESDGAIDVIGALTGLGYSIDQAREVLRQVPVNLDKPEDIIRAALKILGKNR
jgi:Holliday junction DNA helicase RuvA